MATKKAVKRKPNRRVRRKFSKATKNKITRYALKTSLTEAAEKFDVHTSVLSRWRDDGFGKPEARKNRRVRPKVSVEEVSVEQELKRLREDNEKLRDAVIGLLLAQGGK